MAKSVSYIPTEKAKANPRWTLLGSPGKKKKVGIGGEVVIRKKPPKLPITVPEATPAEYEELYELGYVDLIERVEKDVSVKAFSKKVEKEG